MIKNQKNNPLKLGNTFLIITTLLAMTSRSIAAPTGGVVTSGNADISQSGAVTNINQSTHKASINWKSFGIAGHETVNFNQPSVNATTLNQVIGNEASIINGALNANGQVWILNGNGVLFGKSAQINTSGLLASTKNLSDADFQNGNYQFKGDSTHSVVNLGTIDIQNKGYAILLANSVQNEGTIKAVKGNIQLVGANEVSINLNGNSLVNLTVDKGVLDALVENKGAIYANAGEIYLTTNAANDLLKGVVNNTGIIEAQSLDDVTGKIELFAHGGKVQVGGTLKAEDGFIETSGKDFTIAENTLVQTGLWLIDPTDITIDAALASTLQTQLASGDAEVTTVSAGVDTGNIDVNSNITWSTTSKLTLTADNDINVNATIENTNATDGGIYFNATNDVVFGGSGLVKINNVFQLQWMNTALVGKYELGSNIDATATSAWNTSAGFNPVGTNANRFTGTFDGLGHTVSNLFINRAATDYVGLFGYTDGATIQNIGLIANNITGKYYVGGLVGYAVGSTITNAYATGAVSGTNNYVGGLVGEAFNSTITNAYATGAVSGTSDYVGGLVGNAFNLTISNAYATGSVSGIGIYIGGLVGRASTSTITNTYATGAVSGANVVGGLIGATSLPNIINSFWDIDTTGQATSDGGTGLNTIDAFTQANYTGFDFTNDWFLIEDSTRPMLRMEYSTTITNAHQLQLMAMDLTADYTLANNIDMSATQSNASEVWNTTVGFDPLGDAITIFTGTFDGLGHTISNLFINRPSESGIGLFGASNGATIKNIGLIANDITGGYATGGLIGSAKNSTSISNAYTTGTVSGGSSAVGGLVGVSNESSISNSYATGAVTGTDINGQDIGGLVGTMFLGTLNNSYATGAVTGAFNLGGLVGKASTTASITNAYATGTVSGDITVGGLVGEIISSTLTNVYATGAVSGNSNRGGLIGFNTGGNTITNSFWDTDTGYATSAGGTGLTTAQMKDTKTFFDAGWDFDTVWGRDTNNVENAGYLDLRALNSGFTFNTVVALTVADQTKVYDGTDAVTATLSKANVIDGVAFTGNKDVGTYAFTSTLGDYGLSYATGFNSGNTETLLYNSGSATITPKALTLSTITAIPVVASTAVASAGSTETDSASSTETDSTVSNIISSIFNGTAVTSSPLIQPIIPTVNISPYGTSAVKPVDQPSKLITITELRKINNDNSNELRTPVYEDSPLTLINKGIHMPAGVDQQFFVSEDNDGKDER